MINLDNYYLHGINVVFEPKKDIEKTLMIFEKILQKQYVLSRRLQNDLNTKKGGWNGLDYISLCDYQNRNASPYENNPFYIGYTAYKSFICNSLTLIFEKKGLTVVKPELVAPSIFSWDTLEEMRILGNHPTKRYSDLPDEVQIKDKISLENLKGIIIPLTSMSHNQYTAERYDDLVINFFSELKKILINYNQNISIYDLNTKDVLQTEDDVKLILKKSLLK